MAILNRPLKQTLSRCSRYTSEGYIGDYELESYTTSSGDVRDITVFSYASETEKPSSVLLPIDMVLPSQASYSIDDLRNIFGSLLSVRYTENEIYTTGRYEITVYIDNVPCYFSNGTDNMWTNLDITTPFTYIFIKPNE